MKNALKTILLAALATVGLISCDKQENPVAQVPVQTTQSAVKVALQPLIKEMIADETVKTYLLSNVEFTNAHAAWIRTASKSELAAFRAKLVADRKAHLPVQSPIMTRVELEKAYKTQVNQFAQVSKKFPALAQLSEEDNEEVFYQVESAVISGAGVSELVGSSCSAGYRACARKCDGLFTCLDGCYSGYLACAAASQQ